MRNILLKIEYDGTNYAGWQKQNNSRKKTIQETVETALKRILREETKLISCGRTDSGVHAVCHMANFKTLSVIQLFKLRRGLNAVLPNDIVIKEIKETSPDFHSRFKAKSKTYAYTILNGPAPSAILRNYVHHLPYKLNVGLMRREAKSLLGKHNFKSFQASDAEWRDSERSSVRTIKKIGIAKNGELVKISVEADGFLYNMVRNIVGTLIEIGRGRLVEGSMRRILRAKDRKLAGPTAPAKGLCLMEVKFSPPLER